MKVRDDGVPTPSTAGLDLFRTLWMGAPVGEMDKAKEFHKAVFGLQEIRTFQYTDPDRVSATLQFGASVEDAREQTGPAYGVGYRPPEAPVDPIARLILNVTEIGALAASIVAHGGTIVSGPSVNSRGVAVTIARDPAGSSFEMRSLAPGRGLRHRKPMAEIAGMRTTVTAADRDRTASFYKSMFGMQEVARHGSEAMPEIVLQVGRTVEEARNGGGTQLLLATMDRFVPPSLYVPIASQIVLTVANLDAVLARVPAAGGTVYQEGVLMPKTGNYVGRMMDPSGNIFELLCPPGYAG